MPIKKQIPKGGKHIQPTADLFPKSVFNYPVFCFKHLQKDYSLEKCQRDEKIDLIERLCKLSTMTWEQIRLSDRHGLGTEKISQHSIRTGIPNHITPDVTFYALRFSGKKPIVGYKSDFIFHILYIDRDFTLYDHG